MSSTTLFEITRSELSTFEQASKASIEGVKQLSSYNWVNARTPTIVVPGCPPLWTNVNQERQVKKDHGLVYIAQNAARHPGSPLEPLFRAIYITDPHFDISAIDIVTDRNNMRKLLSFVDSSTSKNSSEAFTILVEVVQDTVILSRTETKVEEFIGPKSFRGYGHEFEKAYTKQQIHGSSGHHRIIKYRLGDLNFIIRHETDGCVGTENTSGEQSSEKDDLPQLLGGLSLASAKNPPTISFKGSKLKVRKEGNAAALESTLEIKTRVMHKPMHFGEVAAQLWISQTPKLVRAFHEHGKFRVPVVEDVMEELKEWEVKKQKSLTTLTALLAKIIEAVKGHRHAVIRFDAVQKKLTIESADAKDMLPKDLYSRWELNKAADQ